MAPLAAPNAATTQALTLDPIKLAKTYNGGYTIKYSGKVPPGAKVRLLIGGDTDYIELNPQYHAFQLGALLEILYRKNYWAVTDLRTVDCTVAAFTGNVMVPGTQSEAQELECPVTPVTVKSIGTITALEDLGAVEPKLNYVKDGPTHGRILSKPINGRYYFVLASILETDPANRGFDCTSYVGSALGRHDGMGGTSSDFADSLGAKTDVLTEEHLDKIREFMKTYPVGAYLMWSGGHIVTLINGRVQEFNIPKGAPGYRNTDINAWKAGDSKTKFTLREIPAEFL